MWAVQMWGGLWVGRKQYRWFWWSKRLSERRQRGTSGDFFFLPPEGFHVPYDVSPLKQRYAVGGICAFTQDFWGAGALIYQGWIQEHEQRLLSPGTEEALGWERAGCFASVSDHNSVVSRCFKQGRSGRCGSPKDGCGVGDWITAREMFSWRSV